MAKRNPTPNPTPKKAKPKAARQAKPKQAAQDKGKSRTPIDKQWNNNGKRRPDGKFAPGHDLGFKPGESGNPLGRPKSRTLSEAYRAKLEAAMLGGLGVADAIADQMVAIALGDDPGAAVKAAVEMRRSTEGDKVEHDGEITLLTPEQAEAKRKERWAQIAPTLALALQAEQPEEESGETNAE
jgi:hypothetical protein